MLPSRTALPILIAMTLILSCVERYHPEDMYLKEGLLVISAHITDRPGTSRPAMVPSLFARATYDAATVYSEVNHHYVDCREYKGSSALKPDFGSPKSSICINSST